MSVHFLPFFLRFFADRLIVVKLLLRLNVLWSSVLKSLLWLSVAAVCGLLLPQKTDCTPCLLLKSLFCRTIDKRLLWKDAENVVWADIGLLTDLDVILSWFLAIELSVILPYLLYTVSSLCLSSISLCLMVSPSLELWIRMISLF